jgi:transcriptional regulator with XRE-family HTH domain
LRVAYGISLRDFAAALNCTTVRLGEIERGKREVPGDAQRRNEEPDPAPAPSLSANLWAQLHAAQEEIERLREEVRLLKDSYVPQDIAVECIEALRQAGYGKPGEANTLWAMTHAAVAEVKKLRAVLGLRCALCAVRNALPEAEEVAVLREENTRLRGAVRALRKSLALAEEDRP